MSINLYLRGEWYFFLICQNSDFRVYFLIFARNSSIKLLPWKMLSHVHLRASLARFISINEILLTHILRIITYHDPTYKSILGRPHFSCIKKWIYFSKIIEIKFIIFVSSASFTETFCCESSFSVSSKK